MWRINVGRDSRNLSRHIKLSGANGERGKPLFPSLADHERNHKRLTPSLLRVITPPTHIHTNMGVFMCYFYLRHDWKKKSIWEFRRWRIGCMLVSLQEVDRYGRELSITMGTIQIDLQGVQSTNQFTVFQRLHSSIMKTQKKSIQALSTSWE